MKRFLARGWKASASTALALALTVGAAGAADDTWSSVPTDSGWGNTANWVNATPPGSTTGTTNTDTATFTTSTIVAVTVDAGRNLQNITFGGATFTLSGSPLLLTNGGTILSNGSALDERISAPLQIQGDGGAYKIETNTPGTNRELQISGGISGVATTGNTTVLTLTGSSGGVNEITSAGAITNGSGGGTLALVKDGTGLWVLGQANGANTYSGGTTIKAGTLRVSSSGNTTGLIGPGTLTLEGTGTLALQSTGSTTLNNNVVVNGTGGTVYYRGNGYINPSTLTGTGVLSLTAYASTTVVSSNGFKAFAGTVRAANPMSLRFVSTFDETSLANAVLLLEAGASQTRNYGTNSTRTTDIGTLAGAAGSTLGGSATGSGEFIFSVGGRNEDSTFAGTIVDGGTKTGLTKVGSATLTLTGTNTYTGATTVAAGVLAVDGSIAGSSLTTVNDGAKLQGIGTLGATTVNAGGHVAPGNSIGTLNVSGNMSINGTLDVEYDGDGSLIDLLAVTGNLDITNAAVDFAPLNSALTGSPFIFATYGTLAGSQFASVVDLPGGYTIDYAYNNGTTTTNIALVPEPTAALLAGLGLLGLLRRRRS